MNITRKEIEDGMILFCLSGSHAYGLATPDSDEDFKGVTIAPKRFYTSFLNFEQKDKDWDINQNETGRFPELENGNDFVIYEIRKFLALVQNQNPNILEMLWQDRDTVLYYNELGKELLNNRQIFLTKKIARTFIGYGQAQVKKMLTHRKWLVGDVPIKPSWEDFGVNVDYLTHGEIEAFIEFLYLLIKDRIEFYYEAKELYDLLYDRVDWKAVLKQKPLPVNTEVISTVQNLTRARDDYMELLQASQAYRKQQRDYENYQHWLKTRNPKRAAIEAICGYDGKNASHCIRLVRMATEALTTEKLLVNRQLAGDAEELLAIKTGQISYSLVNELINQSFSIAEQAEKNTKLPSRIDCDYLNTLCMELVDKSGILKEV